jgi:hypothetical protein
VNRVADGAVNGAVNRAAIVIGESKNTVLQTWRAIGSASIDTSCNQRVTQHVGALFFLPVQDFVGRI